MVPSLTATASPLIAVPASRRFLTVCESVIRLGRPSSYPCSRVESMVAIGRRREAKEDAGERGGGRILEDSPAWRERAGMKCGASRDHLARRRHRPSCDLT